MNAPFPPIRPAILAVRPKVTKAAFGGDEVMYRHTFANLRQRWDLDVLELEPIGKLGKVLKIASGVPPECTRFLSRANLDAVAARLRLRRYHGVLLLNEVTFPMLGALKRAGVPGVMVAQNVHSLVASTETGVLARALRPLAVHYERRYYGDPAAPLVCISHADVAALRRAGVARTDITVSPPGAPPPAPLAMDAPVLGEAVITGSYGWWRKARDLAVFGAGPGMGLPIHVADAQAREILGAQAGPLEETAEFWSQGLRFGLITDRFVGGFKLKSLEYVAKNCVVISTGDIAMEFAGLPHSGEFIRIVADKAGAAAVIRQMREAEPRALIGRFLAFKQACVEHFAWARCLEPINAILEKVG